MRIFPRGMAFPAVSREVVMSVVPKCSQALVRVAVEAEGKSGVEWAVVVSASNDRREEGESGRTKPEGAAG
jgi:hypothetical protein